MYTHMQLFAYIPSIRFLLNCNALVSKYNCILFGFHLNVFWYTFCTRFYNLWATMFVLTWTSCYRISGKHKNMIIWFSARFQHGNTNEWWLAVKPSTRAGWHAVLWGTGQLNMLFCSISCTCHLSALYLLGRKACVKSTAGVLIE